MYKLLLSTIFIFPEFIFYNICIYVYKTEAPKLFYFDIMSVSILLDGENYNGNNNRRL